MCNLSEGLIEYGEAQGIPIGKIQGAIMVYRDDLQLTPSEIITRIMTKFNLSQEAAEKYVSETIGLQVV